MPIAIATATASFRTNSEDRLAVHNIPGGVVVVVADGAGGIPGGGRAADLALQFVEEALARPGFNPFIAGSWADLLVEADALFERDRVAGETTCVIVTVGNDGRVVGVSVGDSGAIVARSDGSTDELTEKQKRKLRLGSGRAIPVAFERAALVGTLCVATDGLSYARPDVIARIVTECADLDRAAHALVEAVKLPSDGFVDDVAVVLLRV